MFTGYGRNVLLILLFVQVMNSLGSLALLGPGAEFSAGGDSRGSWLPGSVWCRNALKSFPSCSPQQPPLPNPHHYFYFSLTFEQRTSFFLQTEVMEGGSLVFCVFTVVSKKPLRNHSPQTPPCYSLETFEHMQTVGSTAPKHRKTLAFRGKRMGPFLGVEMGWKRP